MLKHVTHGSWACGCFADEETRQLFWEVCFDVWGSVEHLWRFLPKLCRHITPRTPNHITALPISKYLHETNYVALHGSNARQLYECQLPGEHVNVHTTSLVREVGASKSLSSLCDAAWEGRGRVW